MKACHLCGEQDLPTKRVILTTLVSPPVQNLQILAKMTKQGKNRVRISSPCWLCKRCRNQYPNNIEETKHGHT